MKNKKIGDIDVVCCYFDELPDIYTETGIKLKDFYHEKQRHDFILLIRYTELIFHKCSDIKCRDISFYEELGEIFFELIDTLQEK